MRKHVLFLAALCMTISYANAQYYMGPAGSGNPNETNSENLEYPAGGGLPSGWTVIQSGGNTSPVWSTTQSIPFNFQFNGAPVTAFKVSTSGVLTFSTGVSSVPQHLNYALPHSSIPDNSVCIWGISGKSNNDNIVTKTFGTTPNRQFWISFNDYSLPAIFNSHFTYWSIVLEESSNRIYLVDQRTSTSVTTALTLGIQINDTLATSVAGSPLYNSMSTASPASSDNTYYTFIQGVQPDRDIKGYDILMSDVIAIAKGPHPVKYVIRNEGKDTITSLDLNYSHTGSLKTTATISNLNILPWQVDTIEHPQAWNPPIGKKLLKVWTGNLNGAPDQNPANDTVVDEITVINNFAEHVPLIESFTSSTSAQSKNVNDQLENTLGNETQEYVHVKYPMSWPGSGDPYFTNEGGSRRQFYGVSSVPNLQLDGNDWSNFNYMITTNTMSSARNKQTLLSMSAKYWVNAQTVCTEIEIDPIIDVSNPNLTLYVAIYEKKSIGNVKTSGETEFFNIMKKMLPDQNGTFVSNLTAGNTQTENFCFTFNGSYVLPPNANSPVNLSMNHTIEEFSDLGVAAWLQDNNTMEVLQATNAINSIGIEQNQDNLEFNLFPNPASEEVFIQMNLIHKTPVEVELFDITGTQVLMESLGNQQGYVVLPIALPQLATGVYLVKIKVGEESLVKKLIIE